MNQILLRAAARRASPGRLNPGALVLVLTGWIAASPCSTAWTPLTGKVIAGNVLPTLPEPFRRAFAPHIEDLYRGVAAALDRGTADPRLIAGECRKAVAMLDQRQPFSAVAFQLGRIAGLAACTADPFFAAGAGVDQAAAHRAFQLFTERHLHLIPLVIGDPGAEEDPLLAGTLSLEDYCERCRSRSATYFDDLLGGSAAGTRGAEALLEADVRSTAFAVASVSVSRAGTRAGALWRWIWLQAGGSLERGRETDRRR
jgi:hypothetical protein